MRELEPLQRKITLTDMVAYAGATWDWHRLHYDRDWVTAKGMKDPVVDGQMLGALMAEQILDALGPQAFITRLAFRFKSMVYAGDVVRVEGSVVSEDDGVAALSIRVTADDRLAAEGTAEVRL